MNNLIGHKALLHIENTIIRTTTAIDIMQLAEAFKLIEGSLRRPYPCNTPKLVPVPKAPDTSDTLNKALAAKHAEFEPITGMDVISGAKPTSVTIHSNEGSTVVVNNTPEEPAEVPTKPLKTNKEKNKQVKDLLDVRTSVGQKASAQLQIANIADVAGVSRGLVKAIIDKSSKYTCLRGSKIPTSLVHGTGTISGKAEYVLLTKSIKDL